MGYDEPRFVRSGSGIVALRSDIEVELIDIAASDVTVARSVMIPSLRESWSVEVDPDTDRALINYLIRDGYTVPSEHEMFTFYIEAPVFAWNTVVRHLDASYRDESVRCRKLATAFYMPYSDRDIAQSEPSEPLGPGSDVQREYVEREFVKAITAACDSYELLLSRGIATDVARMVLPVNVYSSAYVTVNVYALMNFLSLLAGTAPHCPCLTREVEIIARKLELIFSSCMPMAYSAFISASRAISWSAAHSKARRAE